MRPKAWRSLGLVLAGYLALVGSALAGPTPGKTPLYAIALRPEVQAALGFSAAQSSALNQVVQNAFAMGKDAPPTPDDLAARQRRADEEVLRMLGTTQRGRIREIGRQLNGFLVMDDPTERSALGLSAAQGKDIDRAIDAYGVEMRAPGLPGMRQTEARARLNRRLEKLLTPEQLRTWKRRQGVRLRIVQPRRGG